jgi:hypothetical protein
MTSRHDTTRPSNPPANQPAGERVTEPAGQAAVPVTTPPGTSADAGAVPVLVEAAVMDAALADGTAHTLSAMVTGLVRYRGHWWIDTTQVWVLVTDETFAASLDARHTRGSWA